MKIISVDNGRSFNKSFCDGKPNVFQAVMSPAEKSFNLTVQSLPSDLWVEYQSENWLIGDLAVRQRPKKVIQDRDINKCNQQNILQTITACSLYAKDENIILLTNIPARDYSEQKGTIQGVFKGTYRITHKAGDMTGKTSNFCITECYALPEGESAYYGAAYDLNLKIVNEDVVKYPTLIVDIGDETTNYISMNPNGEPVDDASGTLKLGLHTVYSDLHKWMSKQGADLNIAQLTRSVIFNEPIYIGSKQAVYSIELNKRYSEFEYSIYSDLNSLLSLRQYRNIIFVGGSVSALKSLLSKRYSFMNTIFTVGSQMLNCYGQYIIYRLTRG